jgi:hypothetical protein
MGDAEATVIWRGPRLARVSPGTYGGGHAPRGCIAQVVLPEK